MLFMVDMQWEQLSRGSSAGISAEALTLAPPDRVLSLPSYKTSYAGMSSLPSGTRRSSTA
jgi:hypothetical protein